jgi:phage tail-like protein
MQVKYSNVEIIKKSLPSFYINDEKETFGITQDEGYELVGKTVVALKDNATYVSVSGYTYSSIPQYFIPANQKTDVTPALFATKILSRFGKTFSDFRSESEFREFLDDNLSSFTLNYPSTAFVNSATNQAYSVLTNANDVHNDLLSSLGALYILNTSGSTGSTTFLSSILTNYLVSSVFHGETFTESLAIQCLYEYFWNNRSVVTAFTKYLPSFYRRSDSSLADNKYVSGNQSIELLKINLDIWYNRRDADTNFVGQLYDIYDTSAVLATKRDSAGPLLGFLKALSYGAYDVDAIIEDLTDLLDIDACPPEFLEYLGKMIGWVMIGGDVESWRAQLRSAVYMYKSKGTKRALINAISFVFPKPITTFDPASSIIEAYESYFPNLLYFTLKTESPICQDLETITHFLRKGQQNSDLTFNLDPDDLDKNVRFCVDAILEEIDRKFNCIRINNQHYTETEFYQSQDQLYHGWIKNGQRVIGKGYEAREGYTLAIPPWETDRFYQNSLLTLEIVEYLRTILGGCDEGQKYYVREEFIDSLIDYIKQKTGIGQETLQFQYPYNNGFKFYTSALEFCPNLEEITSSGISNHLDVIDYWNSQSSQIFVTLDITTTDQDIYGVESVTPQRLSNLNLTLQEFTPFHVTSRIAVKITINDQNYASVDEVCIGLKINIDDTNTSLLASRVVSGFLGTSGIGDFYSSISKTLLHSHGGRYLPASNGSFWSVFGPSVERTATRRRNLRYLITGEGYSRNGKNPPLHGYFYGSSLSGLEVTKEYIPLGFNFSGQHFIPTNSPTLSAIYDTSNAPITRNGAIIVGGPSSLFMGIPVSSVILMRSVKPSESCVSILPLRTLRGRPVFKDIVDYFLRIGQVDNYYLRFDTDILENIEFSGIHKLWSDYGSIFSGNMDGSGFYALDHAFGPLLFNAYLETSGITGTSSVATQNADSVGTGIKLDSAEYSYIYGSNGIDAQAYRTQDNQLLVVDRPGIVWKHGWNSYKNEIDRYEGNEIYSNISQLSGVEVAAKDGSNSLIVAQFPTVPLKECFTTRDHEIIGITFFGGKESVPPNEALKIRFPLLRNKNIIYNGYFINKPIDEVSLNNANLSAIDGWEYKNSNVTLLQFSSNTVTVPTNHILSSGFYAVEFSGNTHLSALTGPYIVSDYLTSIPAGENYIFSFDVSSNSASSTGAVIVQNVTRNNYYEQVSSTWVSGLTILSSVFSSTIGWDTKQFNINTSVSSNVTDAYRIIIGLDSSSTVAKVYIRNVELKRRNENTLFPNRDYSLQLSVNSKSYADKQASNLNKVRVRVLTGNKRFNKLNTKSNFYVFDFRRNRWMLSDPISRRSAFKDFELSDGNTLLDLQFHTRNEYGPLDINTRNLLTEPRFLNVHDEDTYYYIEITPIMDERYISSDLYRPLVNLEYINMTDLTYSDVKANYLRKEAKGIMEFFDDQQVTTASRNSAISVPLGLGANGGSRDIYLDQAGGTIISLTI